MAFTLMQEQLELNKPTADGVEIPLTQKQKGEIVLRKYENLDTTISDVRHSDEWFEQLVADIPMGRSKRPRISLEEGKSGRSITSDDGLIIDIKGTPDGVFGYFNGAYHDEDATEAYEETNDEEVIRSMRWNFRVSRVLQTNGPELRDRHFRTEEAKAEETKTEMFEVIKAAFAQGAEQNPSVSPQDVLKNLDTDALAKELESRKSTKEK